MRIENKILHRDCCSSGSMAKEGDVRSKDSWGASDVGGVGMPGRTGKAAKTNKHRMQQTVTRLCPWPWAETGTTIIRRKRNRKTKEPDSLQLRMPHCYIASDSGSDSDSDSASAPAIAIAFAFAFASAAVDDCGRHWRQRQSIVCIFSVALSVGSRENRGESVENAGENSAADAAAASASVVVLIASTDRLHQQFQRAAGNRTKRSNVIDGCPGCWRKHIRVGLMFRYNRFYLYKIKSN